ncbi:amidohydrolase [Actinomadura sp. KC216]|uniref:amidohydrolase n=1 Tax=Actinomadura sp. KC216 TaxID=2530370 RepID=UPI00140469A3|nr:amidohydrolase [Actinomadura sp. KC216]
MSSTDLALVNGRITTLAADGTPPEVPALAVRDGRIVAAGSADAARRAVAPDADVIDLGGRRAVPGLIDAHVHFVRAGLTWNEEIRWEDVPDLGTALGRLAAAARDRPAGTWLKVVGGWHPDQFAERRAPTRDELDAIAPGHPVFVQCMYSWGMLNTRALTEVGLDRAVAEGVDPAALEVDADGRPTGVLRGMPALRWLYWQLPVPSPEEQVASTAAASRVFSAAGLTGLIDGGGSNTGPDTYRALYETWRRGELTVRTRPTMHASRPGAEAEELPGYLRYTAPGFGDGMLRVLGMGEIIHYAVHDGFHREPDLSEKSLDALRETFAAAARHGWPLQIHAIRRDTLDMVLDLWEELDREVPLAPLRWTIVHCEGLSADGVRRVADLGVGVLVPAMLRFEGDDLIEAWGPEAAGQAPPLRALLDAGVPVGGGTDAIRVASYHPFTALHWYVSGRTIGGRRIRDENNLLTREEALELYTHRAAWFSFEEDERGRLQPGMLADLTVLDRDYLTVPEDEIPAVRADLTLVGGKITWAGPAFGVPRR